MGLRDGPRPGGGTLLGETRLERMLLLEIAN
jgi:hypothetical protein